MQLRFALVFAAVTGSALAVPPDEVARLDLAGAPQTPELSWSAVAGADFYNIYRGRVAAADDHVCVTIVPASTTALTLAPPAGASYYLVSASNADGEGPLGFRAGSPLPNRFPCADADRDGIADWDDNCPFAANPGQEDQNEDGLGDLCDPKTYHFESDAAGGRPGEMSQAGLVNDTFTVLDLGGDRAIAYGTTSGGTYDRFDRLATDFHHQEVTVWVDHNLTPEFLSLELWSDGAYSANAGAGVLLQVGADGEIWLYERLAQDVPFQVGPFAPATGRMRLRLRRDDPVERRSTLHVDAWDGAGWLLDHAVFTIEDDPIYRGFDIAVADFGDGRRALRRLTVEREPPTTALVVVEDARWTQSWKLFQRDGADQAVMPVRVAYRLDEPGRLRARVVDSTSRQPLAGHDWGRHEVALGPADYGVATLTVAAVPTGGNYDLEVRLVLDSGPMAGAATISSVAVGDVYIAGGQSNMSGYSGGLTGAETAVDQVHLFHNDGTWKRGEEPMDDGTDQVDGVSAEMPEHSLMLRFAKDVYLQSGVPVAVIPGSLGGTDLYRDWVRNPLAPADRSTLYGSLLRRASLQGYDAYGAAPRGLVWFQGESDALFSRTTEQYLADLERLVGDYRVDLANPALNVLLAQLGTYRLAFLPGWLQIQEAQRQLVARDGFTALAVAVDQPRSDDIHLNVDGYKEIGARLADRALALGYGQTWRVRTRLLAAVIAFGTQVELRYDGPVSGGSPELFEVVDQSPTAPQVIGVSTLGSTIVLDLDRAPAGQAWVSYGFAVEPTAPWLRDSRGRAVAAFQFVPAN